MTDPFDAAAAAGHQLQQQLAETTQALAAETAQRQADEATITALQAQVDALTHTAWGVNASDPSTAGKRTKALGGIDVLRYFNKPKEGINPGNVDRSGIDLVYSPQVSIPDQAAGKWDAAWLAMLQAQPTDRSTYVSAQHEPESHVERKINGVPAPEYTPAQYCDAMRHLAGLARQVGPHIKVTSILMGWTVNPASGRNWLDYYPGDDVIDVLAWDVYLSAVPIDSRPYQLCRDAAVSKGKPWAIAETGTDRVKLPPPGRYPLLQAMSGWLAASDPPPLFVCYFDNPHCTITDDPQAVAAWSAGQKG